MAVYLASDYGCFTTGEIVRVDGGYHVLGMPQPENLGADAKFPAILRIVLSICPAFFNKIAKWL